MFSNKNVTLRINETLHFLLHQAVAGTPMERNEAFLLAFNYVQNQFPPAHAANPNYIAFSNAMALGWHLSDDPNSVRKMKRASYILSKAIQHHSHLDLRCDPTQIGDAQAPAIFADMVRKAWMVRGILANNNAAANHVLNNVIRHHGPAFLRTNKLTIRGSTAGRDRDLNPLTRQDQNVVNFFFGYEMARDRYAIDPGAVAGSVQFAADNVYAVPWNRVPGRTNNLANGSFNQIHGTELTSQFMVTTQFTGCSFCMKDAGHTYCAHISPSGGGVAGMTGNTMARQLAGLDLNVAGGDFANAAGLNPFHVFGTGYGNPNFPNGYPQGLGGGLSWMSVIGIQSGADHYDIYSQVVQNNLITLQHIFHS